MKISRLEKDTNGAEWMSAAIFVVGLLIVSFIFVFAKQYLNLKHPKLFPQLN